MKALLDTCILLEHPEILNNTEYEYIIHSIVCEELDNIIHGSDQEKKYRARKARNAIKNNKKIEYSLHIPSYSLPLGWDLNKHDNDLLRVCKDLGYLLITSDLNMQIKANNLGIKYIEFDNQQTDDIYNGYRIIDEHTYGVISEELKDGINSLGLLENEYVIIKKSETNTSEFRYSNGNLKRLKIPELKGLKPKNFAQRCALDLLIDQDIPIKILVGKSGSGKTRLAVEVGLYHVLQKGTYGSILFLRNPLGSGEEIGFLSGDKSEKIGDFFRCTQQYVDPSLCKGKDLKNYIEEDIPFYIKGLSYGSKYILTDEAEDMDIKLLRLIGTRIESDSCVVFCGDWKQAEDKFYKNNGLIQLIEKLKGNKLVGIVVLDEDVRSEASKVFADLL
mgnify:CR=1 FL=1